MKGQLYIGDDMVAETVEVVSPPRSGDLLIFEGKRLRIREVGHNVDRKKLQIMCHVPPATLLEQVVSDLGVQADRGFQYFDDETGEIKESEEV